MKRIKVKESDLTRLIERIIWEATPPNVNTPKAKRKAKPKPAKQFNVSDWSGPFTKKIDTFIGNKNFNGAIKFLKGQLATWSKKGNSAGPAWTKQLKQKSAVANKEIQKVEAARRKSKPPKKKPIQKPRKPRQSPMMPMDGGTPKKLKESDLRRLVKRVIIQEQTPTINNMCDLCMAWYSFNSGGVQQNCMCPTCACGTNPQTGPNTSDCEICTQWYAFNPGSVQDNCNCPTCPCSTSTMDKPSWGKDKYREKTGFTDFRPDDMVDYARKLTLRESDLRRIVKSVMNQNTRHNGRGIGSLINRISNR